uniref:Uncharacterized protein n=1 Tax=Kalanchoe fedtschenkoi TaxID=63787 RepID=A0A7N0TJQ2_KALFE
MEEYYHQEAIPFTFREISSAATYSSLLLCSCPVLIKTFHSSCPTVESWIFLDTTKPNKHVQKFKSLKKPNNP